MDKKNYLSTAIFIIIGIILFLIILIPKLNSSVKEMFLSMTNTVQSPVVLIQNNLSKSSSNETAFSYKSKYIEMVKENDLLKKQLVYEKMLKSELLELRKLNEIFENNKFENKKIVSANIIKKNNTGIIKTYVIDKGIDKNVQKGDLCLYGNTLIGRVVSLTKHTASVAVLSEIQNKMSFCLLNNYDVKGFLTVDANKNIIGEIDADDTLSVGDIIVTTGLSKMIPYGIEIGKIKHIYKLNSNSNKRKVLIELSFRDVNVNKVSIVLS